LGEVIGHRRDFGVLPPITNLQAGSGERRGIRLKVEVEEWKRVQHLWTPRAPHARDLSIQTYGPTESIHHIVAGLSLCGWLASLSRVYAPPGPWL
jgi:hypothetical protein